MFLSYPSNPTGIVESKDSPSASLEHSVTNKSSKNDERTDKEMKM